MKKISVFLASLLLFSAIALSFGPAQTAQAFSFSEVDTFSYTRYESVKAGTPLYFYMTLDYASAPDLDLTGWKAALCPVNSTNLSEAVAVFDISNANKQIDEEYRWAQIKLETTLSEDIREGGYTQLIFDGAGNVVGGSGYTRQYVNKTLVGNFGCNLLSDDGYAYAYVYSESPEINADTFPTFYAADRRTPVTSFDAYTTGVDKYGNTVHYYRLNILEPAQFDVIEGECVTCLYAKMGTPTVSVDVSGNNAGAANDGGIGLQYCDAEGFTYVSVLDVEKYIRQYGQRWEVKNPFAGIASGSGNQNSAENEVEDDEEDEPLDIPAIVDGKEVAVYVDEIRGGSSSEIQHSINNLVYWIENLSDAVGAMNQYAPAMRVSKVLSAGILELSIEGGVDISKGVDITFTDANIVGNVKSGDKIIVLHVKHDGSIEYLPAVAGDGTITANFTSLSPVAWFKVEAGGNAGAVSPKTGVSFWDYLLNLFH